MSKEQPDPETNTPPTRTQVKQRALELQRIAERLVSLPKHIRKRLPLPDALVIAIEESARVTAHEAKRRHGQYLGRLMREADNEAIIAALYELERPGAINEHENIRNQLLQAAKEGTSKARVEQLLVLHPNLERQLLHQLVRNAGKEAQKLALLESPGKSPAATKLYSYLKQTIKLKGAS